MYLRIESERECKDVYEHPNNRNNDQHDKHDGDNYRKDHNKTTKKWRRVFICQSLFVEEESLLSKNLRLFEAESDNSFSLAMTVQTSDLGGKLDWVERPTAKTVIEADC